MSTVIAATRVDFWTRFFAYAIDLIAIYVPLLLGDLALRSLVTDLQTRSILESVLGSSIGTLLFAGYFIGLWMSGGTIGQRILGIKVVSTSKEFRLSQALSRVIALAVVSIVVLSVIGFLAFAANRLRGRPYWIDTVSRTRVVSTRHA